jgi:hypothetical protein
VGIACALGACDKRKTEAPAVAPPPAPPPDPTPVLAPLPALPPPAPGYFRIAYLDLDVKLAESTHPASASHGHVIYGGNCILSVYAELQPTGTDFDLDVGTLHTECMDENNHGRPDRPNTCGAPCKTLTAVPGGTATDPYPHDPPVLELYFSSDFGDFLSSGAHVWSDGTVQFYGPACTRWRGRRGTLTPARVAAILTAVERPGTLVTKEPDGRCDEATSARLLVRSHGDHFFHACIPPQGKPPETIAIAVAALGPNPCDAPSTPMPPLAKAAPAEILPESAAAQPFPKEPPAIATTEEGIEVGRATFAVWPDGTVRYAGGVCNHERRGRLPAERVAALLAALDRRGILARGVTMDDPTACCDCWASSLELRVGDNHARLISPGCNYAKSYGFTDAYALVADVVGPNPCSPPDRR